MRLLLLIQYVQPLLLIQYVQLPAPSSDTIRAGNAPPSSDTIRAGNAPPSSDTIRAGNAPPSSDTIRAGNAPPSSDTIRAGNAPPSSDTIRAGNAPPSSDTIRAGNAPPSSDTIRAVLVNQLTHNKCDARGLSLDCSLSARVLRTLYLHVLGANTTRYNYVYLPYLGYIVHVSILKIVPEPTMTNQAPLSLMNRLKKPSLQYLT
ncbi:hypothetical protein DPMN_096972 [Dreissena polymorpha]|uniref:Uncharacterized protein n=1 Tax=Dreissena polymorpha TaxID=45954 RepID=A0A9D4R5X9_DREPO|nr:hypothetical protein DPMN_096972 [Dreissena polymorpha]